MKLNLNKLFPASCGMSPAHDNVVIEYGDIVKRFEETVSVPGFNSPAVKRLVLQFKDGSAYRFHVSEESTKAAGILDKIGTSYGIVNAWEVNKDVYAKDEGLLEKHKAARKEAVEFINQCTLDYS